MKTLKLFLATCLLLSSQFAFAQKSKAVDPDLLPPLPMSPPKAAAKAEVEKAKVELRGGCIIALKKNEGLAPEVKIKNKDKISAVCECVSRELGKGKNLEEIDFIGSFYRGFDNKEQETESSSMYLHEAEKLEENCRLDPNYKVGQPEPRERRINSVNTTSEETEKVAKDKKKNKKK